MIKIKLIYESYFINDFEKKKFLENSKKYIDKFQKFNLKHDIYGCLWICQKTNRIQQILETYIEQKDKLLDLWIKIKNDKRHIIKHHTFITVKKSKFNSWNLNKKLLFKIVSNENDMIDLDKIIIFENKCMAYVDLTK